MWGGILSAGVICGGCGTGVELHPPGGTAKREAAATVRAASTCIIYYMYSMRIYSRRQSTHPYRRYDLAIPANNPSAVGSRISSQ